MARFHRWRREQPLLLESLEDRCLPSYTITDLGTLGGPETIPSAINNAGQVAGISTNPDSVAEHAILYSDGVLTDLGSLGGMDSRSVGLALNATAQVAGYAETADGYAHAFLYDRGTMTDLGTVGGHVSYAYGINDSGRIIGASSPADESTLHATLFSRHDRALDLDPTGVGSIARAINNQNQVVGQRGFDATQYHAFRYENGAFADLGSLDGGDSDAYAINDQGQVVGFSTLASGARHAVLYSEGGITDLGTLGGSTSGAYGINQCGQVVGFSLTPGNQSIHAVLFQDGQVTDLNTFRPPDMDWTFTTANGINDAGQIVAIGKNSVGNTHGFLLTPDDPAAVHRQPREDPLAAQRMAFQPPPESGVLETTLPTTNRPANPMPLVAAETGVKPLAQTGASVTRLPTAAGNHATDIAFLAPDIGRAVWLTGGASDLLAGPWE